MDQYFEECIRLFPEPKTVSNWMMGDLLRELKRDEREIDQCPVTPQHLAGMLSMIKEGTISGKIAKTVFDEMYRTAKTPEEIIKEKGLVQISNSGAIEKAIDEIIAYATKARKNGLVSLEEDADAVEEPFLRKALGLAVDGTDLQEIRKMMELEIGIQEHQGEGVLGGRRSAGRVYQGTAPGLEI